MRSNSTSLKNDTTENPDVLKIVKEDILRILSERRESTSLEIIKDEIKVANPFISKAVKELERNKLITIQENFISINQARTRKRKNYSKKTFSSRESFQKDKKHHRSTHCS